jgi:predicted transcriptional regulator
MARRAVADEARLQEVKRQAAEALAALDAFDDLVEAFLKANSVRADRFGLMAVDRPDFIYRMRRGTDFRRSTLRQVVAFMGSGDEKA